MITITQLVLMETGTYDNMYLRPYEAKDGHRELTTLQEATRFGQNMSPSAVSGVVGDILRPTATPLGNIHVVNGWGNKRFRYFMRLRDTDMQGREFEQYLTGHTDQPGGSYLTGNIDPNMRFYINQSIRMLSSLQMMDFGRQSVSRIESAQHVFFNQFTPGMEDMARRSVNLQRPQDVFSTLQTSEHRRVSENFFDPRTSFAQENLKLSKRQNAVAPTFLSSVLQANAAAQANADYEDSPAKTYGNAEGFVRERAYSEDSALFELHRRTSFENGDSFTFRELMDLCPHLPTVTKLITPTEMYEQQAAMNPNMPVIAPYQAGQFDGWRGQDIYTVWASILSNSIPPLMLDCMLANVGFTIHNHTIAGTYDVRWFYAQPFGQNLDGKMLIDNFGFRLMHETLPVLLGSNPTAFSITGHFDVLGESRLEISLDGQPSVPFATPTFADALFSPVVTVGQDRVRDLSDKLEFFTDNLLGVNVGMTQKAEPRILMSAHDTASTQPQTPYLGGISRASSDSL